VKCPKCRKSIPYEAMEHRACGWKLASRQVVPPVSAEAKREDRSVDSEVARRNIARLKKMIRSKRDANDIYREVTPGHGGRCNCEVCFPKRVTR